MARAVQRIAAHRDFLIHYVYLAENASLETASRFRTAVETCYSELANMPGMGSPARLRSGNRSRLRRWRVRGFEAYLVLYLQLKNGVAIERLIHAKQDYRRFSGQ